MVSKHRVDPRFAAVNAALERAHNVASDYIESLATRPVAILPTPAEMAAALNEPFPEKGTDPGDAVEEWFVRARPGITASSGPRFFGFVVGGTTPAALAGDWLASAIDQNAGLWAASPAAVQTELVVLDWLKSLFHLPAEWTGAMTSGATMSNLVGLAAARQWAGQRLGFDAAGEGLSGNPLIPVVSSEEIHTSARKALATLGLGRTSVRIVPSIGGAADIAALRAELATIPGPAIIVANAGEVNSGAFDDLNAMADLRDAHPGGAWLHVDGAFGLFAAASPSLSHLTAGIERADSVASDAHKWLNVPYDSGFAFVRDHANLKAAFAISASYLIPSDTFDPMNHVPEMSRRFRALPAWCALKAYGRSGMVDMIERCVANTHDFTAFVEATPGLELVSPAPLNIACWRFAPEGMSEPDRDAFNQAAINRMRETGAIYATPTIRNGHAAIRCAFDNWSTTEADIAILKQTVAALIPA